MLQSKISELQGSLNAVKQQNNAAEKLLLGQYDGADKQYTEALESYDQDMRDKNKERDETRADLEDQEDQLRQIREQWAERREEARKRENLQAILDKKKEIQRKETDTLNQAAKFLQAHYRGMLARREQERSRKGKKGKRRKK